MNDEQITDISPDSKKKNESGSKEGGTQAKWQAELLERVNRYLDLLPGQLPKLTRSANSLLNPLFRFLDREVNLASKLLQLVRSNLGEVKLMCEGKIQPLMELKTLALTIYAGSLPKTWKRFTFLETIEVTAWISDFKKRLEQFTKLTGTSDWQKKGVWMGGLLFPEAFLTATRQYVAQNTQSSLDELELKPELWDGKDVGEESFILEGFDIQGGAWVGEALSTSKELTNQVKSVKFTWIKINPADKHKITEDQILAPVYLNTSRKNLLFSVKINCKGIGRNYLYQRGIALIAWTS